MTIKDIYVYDTLRSAVALECIHGDTIENILIDGITQTNSWMVFYFRLSTRSGKPGILRNVTVRNVSADIAFERPDIWHESRFPGRQRGLDFNTFPCMIEGVPGLYVENVSFENVRISHPGRGDEGTAYMPVWRMNTVPETLIRIGDGYERNKRHQGNRKACLEGPGREEGVGYHHH